ncbi:MAG TPA: Fic family protein [Candidatus Angelobacter sp.]|nr:Fic family protein [Candidatus Angelobacter sp.]
MSDDRHSRALDAELITDPDLKAQREVSNGLRQFDAVAELIEYWTHPEHPFKLRLSAILDLHRIALEGLSSYAGNFRPAGIEIKGSKHKPAGAHMVAGLVEEMCDYVNDHWKRKSPVHLSAYVLWRLNWIHPFTDGNGRTSRAVSYLVLCVGLGYRLPGSKTIPEQIAEEKTPYYEALEVADEGFEKTRFPDLRAMEKLIEGLLAKQLVEVLHKATGGEHS